MQDDDLFNVHTVAVSWKFKRVSNTSAIKIVPSTSQGHPTGEWVNARQQVVTDEIRAEEINQRLYKKDDFQKRGFNLLGKIRKDQMGVLEIKLSS
jgi:hypothetical protein